MIIDIMVAYTMLRTNDIFKVATYCGLYHPYSRDSYDNTLYSSIFDIKIDDNECSYYINFYIFNRIFKLITKKISDQILTNEIENFKITKKFDLEMPNYIVLANDCGYEVYEFE